MCAIYYSVMKESHRLLIGVFLGIVLLGMPRATVHAAMLTFVRDLISTSIPGADASHTIQFKTRNSIPPSGHVLVTLEPDAFTVPSAFTVTDVDFAIDSGGGYADRTLALVPSATDDGIAITTGTRGVFNITLNSTTGIPAGAQLKLTVGAEAVFGGVGSSSIANPLSVGSYHIYAATMDPASSPLDAATTMIAIVDSVAVSASPGAVAPVLFNGLPSGVLAAGSHSVELSLQSNTPAYCRYSTTPNVAYASMTSSFPQRSAQLFFVTVGGLQDATTYTYYVRCISFQGIENTTDYAISFSLDVTPASQTSVGGTDPGSVGRGGIGSFPNGSASLYASSVMLIGHAAPQSTVHILVDGKPNSTVQTRSDGTFRASVDQLERGVYTFGMYMIDSAQIRSSTFSSTLTLGQNTSNTISDIVIAPSLVLAQSSVGVGDQARVQGFTAPGATVELVVGPNGTSSAILSARKTITATSTPTGAWSVSLDTSSFSKGIYLLKARAVISDQTASDFSGPIFLGVGQGAPSGKAKDPDLNHDGKVNLIDFSIMLSHWLEDYDAADLNSDGVVNLGDFSILLFYWTG